MRENMNSSFRKHNFSWRFFSKYFNISVLVYKFRKISQDDFIFSKKLNNICVLHKMKCKESKTNTIPTKCVCKKSNRTHLLTYYYYYFYGFFKFVQHFLFIFLFFQLLYYLIKKKKHFTKNPH